MRRTYLFVFMFIAVFSGVVFLFKGARMAPDSDRYCIWADILMNNKYDVGSFPKSNPSGALMSLYFGFTSVIVFTKMISRQFWPELVILLNIISFGLTGVMMSSVVFALTKNRSYIWPFAVLYAFNYEIFQWVYFILSDITYLGINFALYYLIAGVFRNRNIRHVFWRWIGILILLCVNMFYRPVGFCTIPVVLVSFFIWYFRQARPVYKNIALEKYFLFGALALLVISIYLSVLFNLSTRLSDFMKICFIKYIIPWYQEGIVVILRTNTYHHPPRVFLDYVAIAGDRFIHYFYFMDPLFSFKHNLVNSVFFAPLYFFFLSGIGRLIFKKDDPKEDKYLVAIAVLTVLIFALWHSVTTGIDAGWRYRLTAMPYLLVVASFGFSYVKDSFSFGKNWQGFLKKVDSDRIKTAEASIVEFLELKDSRDKSFLDVGCGSGLFSYAAFNLGVKRIVSFDADICSVKCCECLYGKAGSPTNWKIYRGSILDDNFTANLGKFDIVYAWGVLHHTGSMWQAIKKSAILVNDGGYLYMTIYNKVEGIWGSGFWLKVKGFYHYSTWIVKRVSEAVFILSYFARNLARLRNPFPYIRDYKFNNRGMDWMTNIRDWLGGYPYEFATVEEIFKFMKINFPDFNLVNIKTTNTVDTNCFLFKRAY